MIPLVAGEKNYPLRVPPEVYDRIRGLAEPRERSANFVIVRLLRWALSQPDDKLDEALR